RQLASFFLAYAGLTWGNVQEQFVREVGADKVALVGQAYDLLQRFARGPDDLLTLVGAARADLTPAGVKGLALAALQDAAAAALPKALAKFAAKFNPLGLTT